MPNIEVENFPKPKTHKLNITDTQPLYKLKDYKISKKYKTNTLIKDKLKLK